MILDVGLISSISLILSMSYRSNILSWAKNHNFVEFFIYYVKWQGHVIISLYNAAIPKVDIIYYKTEISIIIFLFVLFMTNKSIITRNMSVFKDFNIC